MLVIKNYIDKSKVNGFGVFAGEDIPVNSLVWKYMPEFDIEINLGKFALLPSTIQDYVLHYGNQDKDNNYQICGDNAKFMNHSDNPNISSATDECYALREIKSGEEITCNYKEFDVNFKNF